MTETNPLEWARKYIDQGFSIFPVVAGGKKPDPKFAPHGYLDSFKDYKRADEIWTNFQDGIAIRTGEMSNLYVIDCDLKKDNNGGIAKDGEGNPIQLGLESLKEYFKRLGKDTKFNTRTIKTRSGGAHFYFKLNDEDKSKLDRRKLNRHIGALPGVDLCGEGGYVVAPPSDGYSVVNDAEIKPMPPEVLDLWLSKEEERETDNREEVKEIVPVKLDDNIIAKLKDLFAELYNPSYSFGNRLLLAFTGALALRGVDENTTWQIISKAARENKLTGISRDMIVATFKKVNQDLPITGLSTLKAIVNENKERYSDDIEKELSETFESLEEIQQNDRNKAIAEKIHQLSKAFECFSDFFDKGKSSLTSDKLLKRLRFLAVESPGGSIERTQLYSFHNFYRFDGRVRVAKELEKIRRQMLECARNVHKLHDESVRQYIENLRDRIYNLDKKAENYFSQRDRIEKEIKFCLQFLEWPGDLEIKQKFRDEVTDSIIARSLKQPSELNLPPENGLFRIATRDMTLEGYNENGVLRVKIVDPDYRHLLTYGINATLFDESIMDEAKVWFDFAAKSMGIQGARKFFQHTGYLFISKFPLPTEKSITILLGHSGTGKGTSIGAIEQLFSFDEVSLYGHVGPHKLTDSWEHFSRQSLKNKLLLTNGDIGHGRIYDMAELNELFGGQNTSIETKFHDPTNENPIFKAFWGSTYPLFPISVPGGFWRRVDIILMKEVAETDRDKSLKDRLWKAKNGLFLDSLIGLSYLVAADWKFETELTDAGYEEMWTLYSDSVRVWAEENLTVEPSEIEVARIENKNSGDSQSKLTGDERKTILQRNIEKEIVIDELYKEYEKYCRKNQIDPVKQQTFTATLRSDELGFTVKKMRIENEGKYEGKIKTVIYATLNKKEKEDDESEEKTSSNKLSDAWEAYISGAPLILDPCYYSHLQILPLGDILKIKKNKYDHVLEMQSEVVTYFSKRQNEPQIGVSDTSNLVTTSKKDETPQGHKVFYVQRETATELDGKKVMLRPEDIITLPSDDAERLQADGFGKIIGGN